MYKFKNTEINNKKASEFETKSLLYLAGMRSDSSDIEFFAIDCFNDVTGANNDFSKLWDIQSKNHKSLPPSKIGKSLFTLYDNFISDIEFHQYILFVPPLKNEYLEDSKLNIYGYDNIKFKTRKGIEKSLKEEIARVHKTNSFPLFKNFLASLTIVQDNRKISTYIKRVSKFKNTRIVSEDFYESIFNEIRDLQSSLKNSYIENESITNADEVLKFNRHITKKDINTLLISRFVGIDVFSYSGIPISFLPVITTLQLDEEGIKDLLLECNSNLSRAFFNKNDCRNFWKVSEWIIEALLIDSTQDINSLYNELISKIKIKSPYLTEHTLLYMISLVKTGLKNAG